MTASAPQLRKKSSAATDTKERLDDRLWLASLSISALIYLAHVVSLPILVTYDGHWYIKLAGILGTQRFASEWDFLRTPLFPALLKLSFWCFGRNAAAVIVLQSTMGLAGVWLLGGALKRLGRPREAALVNVTLSAYPTLIAYEHAVLTEAGSFFFVAALVYLLVTPPKKVLLRACGLAAVLTLAYYYRSSFLYMAPVVAAVFCVTSVRQLRSQGVRGSIAFRRAVAHAAIIAAVPFTLAYPWEHQPAVAARAGDVLLYGLVRQAVIPAEDTFWDGARPVYRQALAASLVGDRIPVSGLRNASEYKVLSAIGDRSASARSAFRYAALTYKARYLNAVERNLMLFAGAGGDEGDNAVFRRVIFSGNGSMIMAGPPKFPPLETTFIVAPKKSLIASALETAAPAYDVLIFLAFLATLIVGGVGLLRRDAAMLACSLLPLAYLLLHALVLASQDRMALPVYPVLLMNLVALPGWLAQRAKGRLPDLDRDPLLERADRLAIPVLCGVLVLLAVSHTVYALLSKTTPSSDEAHYMTGVYGIGEAIRTASPATVFNAYVAALGFKQPLICIPAAVLYSVAGDVILASRLSLVLIFIALGLAAYSLFRHLFRPALAATGALLLVTSPVITGLTHRLYVEGLSLLVAVVYLDVLLRRPFARWRNVLLLGLVFGLGLLTKSLIIPLLMPPTLYIVCVEILEAPKTARLFTALAAKLAAFAAVAVAIAYTWYGFNSNGSRVFGLAFAIAGTASRECKYPVVPAFLSMMSSAPFFFVSALAGFGLLAGLRCIYVSGPDRARRDAWVIVCLSSSTMFALGLMGANQSIRYIAAGLPMIAALAVYGILALGRSGKLVFASLACAAVLSVVLCLQNSFGLLPIPVVRFGNVRVLDSRFPLNPPDWFDDNHPLDRRDFGVLRTLQTIVDDAERQHVARKPVRVGLLVHGFVINHDYLNLLAQTRHLEFEFRPHYWTTVYGPAAPEYLISCIGCGAVYPGRHYYDSLPAFPSEAAAGRTDYQLAFEVRGDAGCRILGFRRKT